MPTKPTKRHNQSRPLAGLAFALVLSLQAIGPAHSSVATVQRDFTAHDYITLLEASQSGVSFTFHSHSKSDARNFILALPYGSQAALSSARTYGARLQSHDEAFAASNGTVVELGSVSSVRGWRIISLTLRPRQGDILFDSITVTISFANSDIGSASRSAFSSPRMHDPGFFSAIFAASMINYENALTWANTPSALSRITRAPASSTAFNYASNWYKLTVTEDGLTRVDAAEVGLAGVSSSRVRMFYSGGEPLFAPNQFARPSFDEIPILVFDGGDGSFDNGDYVLFYGEAANRWRYPSDSVPKFVRNIYTDDNFFWLTGDDNGFPAPAKRMTQIDGSASGAVGPKITSARRQIRIEQEALFSRTGANHVLDYYNWYWMKGTSHATSAFAAAAISDPAQDDTTRYRAHIIAGSASMFADNLSVTPVTNFSQHFWSFAGGPLTEKIVPFRFSMSQFFSRGPYFDFLEVDYLAELRLSQLQLAFSGPKENTRREFSVGGATSALLTLNIDDPRNPLQLTGGSLQSGRWSFAANLNSAASNRFYVVDPAAVKRPGSIRALTTVNLRADTLRQADFIIIAPGAWEGDLERYISYREGRSNTKARFVPVDRLYDEFGFGSPDPSAIRDYLKYTFEHFPSPAPSTVLLVGDGTYDFRNITGGALNLLPPYTSPLDDGFASDDHYVYFDDFAFLDSDTNNIPGSVLGVDMVPARWPVRNLTELNRVIDKIISYESTPLYGPWRNEIILLADDEFGEFVNESVHVTQTETLERGHIPPRFLRNKIYLWDFPRNSLQERPTVNDEIVRSINQGSVIVNYVGHGNPELFAHERVFTLSADVPRLQNGPKLPLFFTASCSIGFFDSPTAEGMAEELLRMDNGAIAVISATRLVYSSANAEFNKVAFDQMFSSQNLTMAQAVFAAKLSRQNTSGTQQNDRRYSFFGDPYLRLAQPQHAVNISLDTDSLMALQLSVVSGTVVDGNGQALTGFNGSALITIRDSRTTRNHKVLNSAGNVSADMFYDVNGPIVFRGSAAVVNGAFTISFIPSLDIAFGGTDAGVSVYASSGDADASGAITNVTVGAAIPTTNDNTGPQISVNFGNRSSFSSGDPVTPGEIMRIGLYDTSGINLSGGFGHNITLIIDDEVTAEIDLTADFIYFPGSFRRGEITHQLESLAPGDHTFKIKAWDNANNSSTVEFSAEAVAGASAMEIRDLLNYPNPMTDNTGFYFTLMAPAERMSLQIFTLSGIKIYEAFESNLAASYHKDIFSWNGRDKDGDEVANGVYLYRAVAYPSAGTGQIAEQFGKLVINK